MTASTTQSVSAERRQRLGLLTEPLGYVDGQNLYEYVTGNPLTGQDALGLRKITQDEQKLLDNARSQAIREVDEDRDHEWTNDQKQQYKESLGKGLDALTKAIEAIQGQDPDEIEAALWAIKQYVDKNENYQLEKECPAIENGPSKVGAGGRNYKCNRFVADCYGIGAGVGFDISRTTGEKTEKAGVPLAREESGAWPPVANDLGRATGNLRSLKFGKNARPQGDKPAEITPSTGMIVAFPLPGGTGHSGIMLGSSAVISARAAGIRIEAIESVYPERTAICRTYTGSGKWSRD